MKATNDTDRLARGEKAKLSGLRRDLLGWAAANGRDFPWRASHATPYHQVAVEVLLQRTTATAVAGFYDRFFSRYRSWHELAAASTEELGELLKPLGLWRRRAASLLGLAQYAASTNGRFPLDPAEHAAIPAVGQYVSNAVMIFVHGEAAPLLDVNMARVIERYVRPRRLADIRHDPWLQEAAGWFAGCTDSRRANWAILDFAATVCKARRPECETCPVSTRCAYYRVSARRLKAQK
jgi:A/G-specific adenine glycosylase